MICSSSEASGKINAFQRLMLQWSELHPYNATHIYRLARPLAAGALTSAVRETFLAAGIGIAELGTDGRSYRHRPDPNPEVEVIWDAEDPEAELAAHVTRELNRPFDRPRCKPWRFSALEIDRDSHYLIVTYDHWVADSVAARLVLRQVLDRYCRWNTPEGRMPLDLYPGAYREVFAHRLGVRGLLRSGVNALRQLQNGRSVAQVPYSSSLHMDIGFELYRADGGAVSRLRRFARSQGATVHDVMLAALGRAMAECLPRRASRQNRNLSLGTIVDTRSEANEDLSGSLGAFLGYYLAPLPADRSMGLTDAVRRIAAVTRPIKQRRAYLDALLTMKLAGAVWPFLPKRSKPFFMRRTLPITAGVSNVVVRDGWVEQSGGDIVEYIRGASTGPILPLVLSPTTLGDEMNVGVSYRLAGFTRRKIDGVMEMFMDQIEHPQGVRRRMPRDRRPSTPVLSYPEPIERESSLAAVG